MALNFPASPVDGQIYTDVATGSKYKYLATFGYWSVLSRTAYVQTSNTAPVSPDAGDLWWNDVLGEMYVYYTDSNSSQWVITSAAGTGGYTFNSFLFDTVNTAFNKANTSCTKTDQFETISILGFNQANAAFLTANAAYITANAAYITANAAYLTVNTAFAATNAAFAKANSALPNTTVTLAGNLTTVGNVIPVTSNTYDLGTSSLRWKNIYTNDLNLSNGIGDYTVVEGEDDLFLYNNRSGKVFKFALIEVDPSEAPKKAE